MKQEIKKDTLKSIISKQQKIIIVFGKIMTTINKTLRLSQDELNRIEAIKDPDVKLAAWLRRAVLMRLEAAEAGMKTEKPEIQLDLTEQGQGIRTTQKERYDMVRQCLEKGMNANQIADHLNSNNYLPQRGNSFTLASVRSIIKRIKDEE